MSCFKPHYLHLLLLLFIFSNAFLAASAEAPPAAAITVDFARPVSPTAVHGFLHGLDVPDAVIAPLRPAWWRIGGNINEYTRTTNLGAQVQIVLSDSYGYPLNNWNGKGAPWENDWKNWEAHVRHMAWMYEGADVYWDVWNEPDEKPWNAEKFWNGTRDQFFETYKHAYTVLREELGDSAVIGGPSYANYEQADLEAFLNYCNGNQLEVNFLSWHELQEADPHIPGIAAHIVYMRKLAAGYPNLKTTRILINETVGSKTQYAPGDILAFLYYLEAGGADGAIKSCWDADNGSSNCFNGSLNGIVEPGTHQPRAAWWAYKTYADTLADRVGTVVQSPNLVAFASKNRLILLGSFGPDAPASTSPEIHLQNLDVLGIGDTMRTIVLKIPASGEDVLPAPILVSDTRVDITGGEASIQIPSIGPHEEYVIRLEP